MINYLIFFIILTAFSAKLILLSFLITALFNKNKDAKRILLLIGALVGNVFTDVSWLLYQINNLFYSCINLRIIYFFCCIAWVFCLLQYQFLAIFIESLTIRNYALPIHQKILFPFTVFYSGYFLFIGFFHFKFSEKYWYGDLFLIIANFIFLLLLFSAFFVLKKIRHPDYPKILKLQLITILNYIVYPLILLGISEVIHIIIYSRTSYIITGVHSLIYAVSIYYCAFKVMRLRFLNFQNQVKDPHTFPFFKKFRQSIAKLGTVTHIQQLEPVIQLAFKDIFLIEPHFVEFLLRKSTQIRNIEEEKNSYQLSKSEQIIEREFVQNELLYTYMHEQRIAIYDEMFLTIYIIKHISMMQ